MRIALFGPPGAGKGTQARLLMERHGLAHISTGNILRTAMKEDTPVGRETRRYYEAGQLVPDTIVWKLAREAIIAEDYDGLILDGYPRTVQQAEWLTAFLEDHQAPLHCVISFILPDEVIVDRLSKRRVHRVTGENYHLDHKPPPSDIDQTLIMQRKDDEPEAIRRRLQVYKDETRPVEAYYRKLGLLMEVDALGDFETVYNRIVPMLP